MARSSALDGLLEYDRLGDFAPSPDHDRLAMVVHGDHARLVMLELGSPSARPVPLPHAPPGVNRCVWHPGGHRLLVTTDPVGNENNQLAELDADTGRVLWSVGRPRSTQAIGPIMDNHPRPYNPAGTALAYCGNARDPEGLDIVVRDLATGVETIVLRGDNRYYPVAWSPDERQLLVKRVHQNTEHDLFVCEVATGQVRRLTTTARYHNAGWSSGGDQLVLLTDLGRDLLAPALLDVATGQVRWLAEPDREVSGSALSAAGRHLAWGFVHDGQSHWFVDDLTTGRRREVRSLPRGVVAEGLGMNGHGTVHLDRHGTSLITRLDTPTTPAEVYRIDLTADSADSGARRLTRLGATLSVTDLVEPTHVRIHNRDGLPMHAQLYRPAVRGQVPMVMFVHGGPEDAHDHAYAPDLQGLLRAGIGVLAPDIRGSIGYGRSFQRLSIHDWGGGDVRDVVDCVRYLADLDWADTTRLGILGGSYGGFLTLACITRHPELWRAAVDIFGPSDLVREAETLPPHWRRRAVGWIGDTSDPADRARLVEHSPITHAHRITMPLLVVQGAHDPRVPPEQSDRLVARLTELGRPVELLEMADEGHGFSSRANHNRVTNAVVNWFRTHLVGPGRSRAGPPAGHASTES